MARRLRTGQEGLVLGFYSLPFKWLGFSIGPLDTFALWVVWQIQCQAIQAAGNWGRAGAWPHILALVRDAATPKSLLLAAIGAGASIRPAEARSVLVDLADSDDEEIAEGRLTRPSRWLKRFETKKATTKLEVSGSIEWCHATVLPTLRSTANIFVLRAQDKLARIVYHLVTTRQEFEATVFESLQRI